MYLRFLALLSFGQYNKIMKIRLEKLKPAGLTTAQFKALDIMPTDTDIFGGELLERHVEAQKEAKLYIGLAEPPKKSKNIFYLFFFQF